MSEVRKNVAGEKELDIAMRESGSLIVKKGFSYNQTKKVFDLVLEHLKDVPYQSTSSNKE